MKRDSYFGEVVEFLIAKKVMEPKHATKNISREINTIKRIIKLAH
jgi:hypothetical protein